jgi:hypothetical protein
MQALVKPGIYQVRFAVRDARTGRVGSASQWVEVPDLATKHLAMSSVLIGERRKDSSAANERVPASSPLPATEGVVLTRKFDHASFLRFLTFIYNSKMGASQPSDKPDIVLQVQIFHDNQPVVTTALRKLSTEGVQDLSRLPYAAETSLAGLPPGNYAIKITAIDRIAKQSVSQLANFSIEN